MQTITFTERGESRDFWPDFDDNGEVRFDERTGMAAGESRITYFQRGQVAVVPPAMARRMISLGYAVDGEVDLPPPGDAAAPGESAVTPESGESGE